MVSEPWCWTVLVFSDLALVPSSCSMVGTAKDCTTVHSQLLAHCFQTFG